ncbi:hypothetical protein KSF_003730 [Reticulibacter mediterranei]|uniref:Uncharacterized protein n=1 Tax=Reticulibacter mediterranei TaxID=2778369 RepID=A0A8J3MZL1_9CHLR|nr:hypothetical protein KSF_003730 [Reticulibacter mediterranei]
MNTTKVQEDHPWSYHHAQSAESGESCFNVERRVYQVFSQRSLSSLGFFTPDVQLYACTCLGCGNTTLRPDPDDLKRLQKAAEKGHTIEF